MKKTVIILGVVIVILLGILAFYNPARGPSGGNPSATSTVSGASSTVQPMVSADGHVVVIAPLPYDEIASSVTVEGAVTGGGWFFENSFPVKVLDGNGKVIGQGVAQAGGASGSWMSTGTVPFTAKVTFTTPKYATGTVVLSKDNPSGMPQNDLSVSVPVIFSDQIPGATQGTVTGQVLLGPTCPVQKNPPDPNCADKPYATNVLVYRGTDTNALVKSVSTDASGNFTVTLAPGTYTMTGQSGSRFPLCAATQVTVIAGIHKTLNLSCDTGIR